MRIYRYVSFVMASIFDIWYLLTIAKTLDIILVKGKRDGEANLFDVLSAVIHTYMSIFFFPTFFVNLMIFLKELTMNQTAWTLEEEYPEGYALNGMINIDILYWLGVEEDLDWYKD